MQFLFFIITFSRNNFFCYFLLLILVLYKNFCNNNNFISSLLQRFTRVCQFSGILFFYYYYYDCCCILLPISFNTNPSIIWEFNFKHLITIFTLNPHNIFSFYVKVPQKMIINNNCVKYNTKQKKPRNMSKHQ